MTSSRLKRPTICLATRNHGKIREIQEVLGPLGVQLASLDDFGPIAEPEETGETFADNATQKAIYYARATGAWALADDSGLVVDALGGEPGVRSARYAADRLPAGATRAAIDAANNARLLEELHAVADDKRTARFVCCLALADGDRVLLEACDNVEGRILRAPRGHNGFGYDPLFFMDEKGRTTAELPAQDKNLISHRGKALRHFARLLETLLA